MFAVFKVSATPKSLIANQLINAGGYILEITSAGQVQGRVYNQQSNSGEVGASIDKAGVFLVAYRFSSATAAGAELFLNGRTQGTADTLTLEGGSRKVSIGSHPGHTAFFNGDIAELLIYKALLSDDESARVNQYLRTKYDSHGAENKLQEAAN